MHLIANWEVLGEEIKENIKISYGRPDSIVGGLQIKKMSGCRKQRKVEYGYSVMDWCKYILRRRILVRRNFHKISCIHVGLQNIGFVG